MGLTHPFVDFQHPDIHLVQVEVGTAQEFPLVPWISWDSNGMVMHISQALHMGLGMAKKMETIMVFLRVRRK